MTHDRSAGANSRSAPIEGSATVTIAMSRMSTNCVVARRASASPRDEVSCIRCLTASVMTLPPVGRGTRIPLARKTIRNSASGCQGNQVRSYEMPGTIPSTATDPRPQRADARRNHERILVAARDAFAQAGRDVQMPDIARAAGVGVGTLYRHFPAKEDLVRALVRDKVQAGNENPWNSDEARRGAAAVLDRARRASAIRTDLTVDDWQALMCGLSAAIATGADAARQAEFVLAAVHSR